MAQSLTVPMRIREEGREERSAPVLVTVSIETDAESSSPRSLMCFQLTDETDPFFLYTLRISEDEFQAFKQEQSILVDFAKFPPRFLELLRYCQPSDGADAPNFAVSLVAGSASTALQIVETNEFKNLTHLRLDMRAGNDAAIKRYLAGELAKMTAERDGLQRALQQQGDEAKESSETAEKLLADAKNQGASAVQELNLLKLEHASACASLREQAVELQQRLQVQADAERTELTRCHRDKEAHWMTQMDELRQRLELTTAEKDKFISQTRELQTRLSSVEQDLASCKGELVTVRAENKELDKCKHENLKTIQSHEVRISTLQQHVVDGEAMAAQLNKLVDSAHSQKSGLEENLRMLRDSNLKLEDKVRLTSAEVTKANDYIERLHDEIKGLKTKLKVKAAVVMQQEQVVQDHEKAIAQLNTQLTASDQSVTERDGQLDILKSKLSHAEARLAEAERTMESNQQVISWLNKEVNEAQIATRGTWSATSFRPALPSSSFASSVGAKLAFSQPNPEALLASARVSSKSASFATHVTASPQVPGHHNTSAHSTGSYGFDIADKESDKQTQSNRSRQVVYHPAGPRSPKP